MRFVASFVVAAVTVATVAQAAPDPDRKWVYNGKAMGTVVSVFLWSDDEKKASKAAEAVFAEMKRIDTVMTTWTASSVRRFGI